MSYRIDNFIDGGTTESRSERFGAIFNPATGQQQGAPSFSAPPMSVPRRLPAPSAPLLTGPRPRPGAGPGAVSLQGADGAAQGRAGPAHQPRARQGLLRCPGELTRGLEVVEFACGIPHLLRGALPQRGPWCRQPLHDAAGGGLRRHHAVQLPGHGAALDVPGGPWPAANLHPQALREGSVPLLRMAELLKQAGLPDGVLNVVNGDKGGGGRAADRPQGRRRVVRRLYPIAQYIYATASAHGKAGAGLAAPRTTWW